MNVVGTVKTLAKKGTNEIVKHSPEILTTMCVTGTVVTVITAVRATPEAIRLLDDAAVLKYNSLDICEEVSYNEWLGCDENSENSGCIDVRSRLRVLTPAEIIQATWKCYMPSIVLGCLSIGCGIGAQSINSRRNIALASAYSLAEDAFNDYKSHVVDRIDEVKQQEIVDAIGEDKVQNAECTDIVANNGEHLFYDSLTGRYFKSDLQKVRAAINDFNEELINDIYGTMNDWFFLIGLPSIKIGDDLGWNTDKLLKVSFSSQITLRDEPCIVVLYDSLPSPSFR